MKSDNRKKAGLRQPIPIPSRKWKQITTNLVADLPPSGGYTTITVFVDPLTKMVHFTPYAKELVQTNTLSYLSTMCFNYMAGLR